VFLIFLLCGIVFTAAAQEQPYLLLQGPTTKKTYRFLRGQTLEWRLLGEEEFFDARINELFPESQAIRIDDMILTMDKIAEVRHRKRGAGLRTYLFAQGLFNLAFIGGYSAFPSEDRDRQKSFLIIATAVSAAMVAVGKFGKIATREVGPNSRYLLKVAGGDLRKGDTGSQRNP